MMKRFLLLVVFFSVGVCIVLSDKRNTWHKFYCSTVLPVTSWKPVSVGLFACSNVEQSILNQSSDNVEFEKQDGPAGYQAIRPKDPGRPAVFRVRVKRDRSNVMFFPRTNGKDCRIEIYQVKDEFKRKLFDVSGTDAGWSPIGQMYELNLGCVDLGDKDNVFDVVLEFVVHGRWSQVWALDSKVFF